MQILNITGNSVLIQWQPIQEIPKNVQDFYGYVIQYKETLTSTNYTISGEVDYISDSRWMIESLYSNTVYDIKLTPIRKYERILDLGTPFQTLRVKTRCSGK